MSFGHLMRTADSLEKTLMLGKIEGRRRRGRQRARWLDGITDLMDVNLSKLLGIVKDRQGSLACCSPWVAELDTNEQLNSNIKGMCNWGSKNTRCVPRSKRLSTPSVDPAGSKTGLPVHCCWEPWMGALPIASILLIGPTIPILGICPKYSLAKIEYHVCMRLFIVVFF